jgi:hypothetical protein
MVCQRLTIMAVGAAVRQAELGHSAAFANCA